MGTVSVFTADRMLAIENGTIVDGDVVGDNLILTKKDGTPVDAGNVRGPQGTTGNTGATGADAAFIVRAASTGNVPTMSGLLTADGLTLADGDRVLLKDQTTASQNGIWIAHPTAWTRATDFDTAAKVAGAIVRVQSGTTHGGTRWTTSFKGTDTVGSTAMSWLRVMDGFNAAYISQNGGSTDASGFMTITHNLGWIPRMIFGMCANPSTKFPVLWGCDTINTTTFRARFMNASSAGGLASLDIGSYVFLCIR